MVDPFRVGGIGNWLKAAAIAEAFNRPVVSHLAPEIPVHRKRWRGTSAGENTTSAVRAGHPASD